MNILGVWPGEKRGQSDGKCRAHVVLHGLDPSLPRGACLGWMIPRARDPRRRRSLGAVQIGRPGLPLLASLLVPRSVRRRVAQKRLGTRGWRRRRTLQYILRPGPHHRGRAVRAYAPEGQASHIQTTRRNTATPRYRQSWRTRIKMEGECLCKGRSKSRCSLVKLRGSRPS